MILRCIILSRGCRRQLTCRPIPTENRSTKIGTVDLIIVWAPTGMFCKPRVLVPTYKSSHEATRIPPAKLSSRPQQQ